MILFFDTETTGLYDRRLPYGHRSQPSLVQIAAKLVHDDGTPSSSFSLIVQPEVEIPAAASAVHGITNELAQKYGIRLGSALGLFNHLRRRADLIVAHNAKFDMAIMECVAARVAFDAESTETPVFCTMEAASPIVNLPPTDRMKAAGFDKPKPPRLEECISHFFGEKLDGAHDALVDVDACIRVYFHLKSLELRKNG